MRTLFTLLFLSCLFFISEIQAQTPIPIGPDLDGEAQNDNFGSALSLSTDGQFLAVGAEQNDGNGLASGHVRVFQRQGSSWVQRGNDIDGAAAGDQSGAVAISDDGTRVVIGSPYSNATPIAAGQARVFSYNGTTWTQLGAAINGDAAGDQFGHAVDISSDGNTIVIGAPLSDDNFNTDSGQTRIYGYSGGSWVQKGSSINGEHLFDNSGSSVSLTSDGNRVAIGAYKNDDGGVDAGQVRVFSFNGTNWIQEGLDIDGGPGDWFGWDVELSEYDYLIVGAPHHSGSGWSENGVARTYIYRNNLNLWQQFGQDLLGESSGDWFGYSVAVSGGSSVIAIGAIKNDGTGQDAGNVKVYQSIGFNWVLYPQLDGEYAGDWFGYSLDLSYDGKIMAVGAINNDPSGTAPNTGHVRWLDMSDLVANEEVDQSEDTFNVFPNPNDGKFTIELGEVMKNVAVTITTVTGKIVYQNEFQQIKSTELELSNAGVYFITIAPQNQQAKTLRVIKR